MIAQNPTYTPTFRGKGKRKVIGLCAKGLQASGPLLSYTPSKPAWPPVRCCVTFSGVLTLLASLNPPAHSFHHGPFRKLSP